MKSILENVLVVIELSLLLTLTIILQYGPLVVISYFAKNLITK
jgi:hypothetical protein